MFQLATPCQCSYVDAVDEQNYRSAAMDDQFSTIGRLLLPEPIWICVELETFAVWSGFPCGRNMALEPSLPAIRSLESILMHYILLLFFKPTATSDKRRAEYDLISGLP